MQESAFNENTAEAFGIAIGLFGCVFSLIIFLAPLVWCIVSIRFAKKTQQAGWKISALISGLFWLVITVLLAVSVINANRMARLAMEHDEPIALYFDDGSRMVSLTTDRDWRYMQDAIEGAMGQIGHNTNGHRIAVFAISKEDFIGPLDEFGDWVARRYCGDTYAEPWNRLPGEVAGFPMERIDMNTVSGEDELVQVSFVIDTPNTYYHILCWSFRHARVDATEQFNSIHRTFRLLSE